MTTTCTENEHNLFFLPWIITYLYDFFFYLNDLYIINNKKTPLQFPILAVFVHIENAYRGLEVRIHGRIKSFFSAI